jgi:hypothetical protein
VEGFKYCASSLPSVRTVLQAEKKGKKGRKKKVRNSETKDAEQETVHILLTQLI